MARIWSTIPAHVHETLTAAWDEILSPKDDRDLAIFDIVIWSSGTFDLQFSLLGEKPTKLRAPRQTTTLPLQEVLGPGIRVQKIREDPDCDAELAHLLDLCITDCKMLQFLPSQRPYRPQKVSRNWDDDDMDMLEKAGVIEAGPSMLDSGAFKVAKDESWSRFILNCKFFNQLLSEGGFKIPAMGLPRLHTILAEALKFEYCATADAKSYFYQIPLHIKMQQWFGFLAGRRRGAFRRFVMKALPMGFCCAPAIAQRISNFIIKKLTDLIPNIAAFVWVDNFVIFAHEKGTLHAAQVALENLLKEFNIQIKAWDLSGDLLGLHFDLINKTISLQPEFVQNTLSLDAWVRPQDNIAFLKLAGSVMYANHTVMRTPLCFFPAFMSHLTVVSQAVAKGSNCVIAYSAALFNELSMLFGIIRDGLPLTPDRMPQVECTHDVWTDACTKTIAAVLELPSLDIIKTFTPSSGATIPPKKMFLAETLAVLMASCLWASWNLHLLTDNQIVYYALTKGHSSSALMNKFLQRIFIANNIPSWEWQSTTILRADGPSRGCWPSPRSVRPKSLLTAQRWMTRNV